MIPFSKTKQTNQRMSNSLDFRVFMTFLFFTITSCEHGGNFDYYIDNKSNHKIKVQFTPVTSNDINVDTVLTINEKTKTIIFRWESVNAGDGRQKDLPFKIRKLTPIEDTLKINKDWNSIDNWDFSTNGKTWGPESDYTFEIDEADIIKKAL
jgi:hypothetical protein